MEQWCNSAEQVNNVMDLGGVTYCFSIVEVLSVVDRLTVGTCVVHFCK